MTYNTVSGEKSTYTGVFNGVEGTRTSKLAVGDRVRVAGRKSDPLTGKVTTVNVVLTSVVGNFGYQVAGSPFGWLSTRAPNERRAVLRPACSAVRRCAALSCGVSGTVSPCSGSAVRRT